MMNRPGLKGQLLEYMREFYPCIEDIHTRLIGGQFRYSSMRRDSIKQFQQRGYLMEA